MEFRGAATSEVLNEPVRIRIGPYRVEIDGDLRRSHLTEGTQSATPDLQSRRLQDTKRQIREKQGALGSPVAKGYEVGSIHRSRN